MGQATEPASGCFGTDSTPASATPGSALTPEECVDDLRLWPDRCARGEVDGRKFVQSKGGTRCAPFPPAAADVSDAMDDPRAWVEPVVVVACAMMSGLTSFGDAIMLHVVFVVVGGLGAVDYEVQRVTYLTSLLAGTAVWFMLASSWKEQSLHSIALSLAVLVPGVTMASLMTGILLTIGDTRPIQVGMGAVFMAFSIWRLTVMVGLKAPRTPEEVKAAGNSTTALAQAAAKTTEVAPPAAPTPDGAGPRRTHRPGVSTGRSTAALVVAEPAGSVSSLAEPRRLSFDLVCPVGAPGAAEKRAPAGDDGFCAAAKPLGDCAVAESAFDHARRPASVLGPGEADSKRFPRPSEHAEPAGPPPAGFAPPAREVPPPPSGADAETRSCADRFALRWHALPRLGELAAFLVAGACAGVLGGLTGANGPPLMAVFAVLGTHKDRVRAVYVWYLLVEVGARLAVFGTSGGAVTAHFPAWRVAVIAGCAVCGFGAGTYLRRFFDTEAILKGLLCLVLTSACLQVGVLREGWVAIGVLGPLLVWGAWLIIAIMRRRADERSLALRSGGPKSRRRITVVASEEGPSHQAAASTAEPGAAAAASVPH